MVCGDAFPRVIWCNKDRPSPIGQRDRDAFVGVMTQVRAESPEGSSAKKENAVWAKVLKVGSKCCKTGLNFWPVEVKFVDVIFGWVVLANVSEEDLVTGYAAGT